MTSKRLRLDSDAYRKLHRRILERDGWHCQRCGAMTNLHVHHILSRARGGSDCERNLITLCAACHRTLHEKL